MGVLKHSDLFLTNRDGKSYRAQVAQMKEYFGKGVLLDGVIEPDVSVLSPEDGAGLSGADRYLESDEIIDVDGPGALTCETELIRSVDVYEIPVVIWENTSTAKILDGTPFIDDSIVEFFYKPDDDLFTKPTGQLFSCGRENNRLLIEAGLLKWSYGINSTEQDTVEFSYLVGNKIYLPSSFNHFLVVRVGNNAHVYVNGHKVIVSQFTSVNESYYNNYYFGSTRDGSPYWPMTGLTNNYYIGPKNGRYDFDEGSNFIAPKINTLSSDGAYYYWGFEDGVTPAWQVNIGALPVTGTDTSNLQLSFPSDQGFDCFRPGDVVQGTPGGTQVTAVATTGNVTNPGNIVDGKTDASALFDTPGATLKVNFPTPLIGVQKLELMLYTGSVTGAGDMEYAVNQSTTYTAATFDKSNSHAWNDATSLLTDGTVSDIYIRLKGSPNGAARAIRVTNSTGTFIVDNTGATDVSIINIDADNNQITVDGGNWTGTDGSGTPGEQTKLVKETPYDTKLTVKSTKDIDNPAFSGDVFMTDELGDGPFNQTPYNLETSLITKVDSRVADYSSSLTCSAGFASPASRAFNGETVTSGPGYYSGGTTCFPNDLATWQWSKEINFRTLKIYALLHSDGPSAMGYIEVKNATSGWIQLSGFLGETSNADFNNVGIDTGLDVTNQVSALNGKIDGLRFKANGSTGWGLWGIEVDGYLLVDGNTETELSFLSVNPDLQYFRPGDIVQRTVFSLIKMVGFVTVVSGYKLTGTPFKTYTNDRRGHLTGDYLF